MADLSDVEQALVDVAAAALYPSGVPAGNLSPVCERAVRIRRGWPIAENLDTDLAAGIVNVTVFSDPNMTRRTTRYPQDPKVITAPNPTLTHTTSGDVVTFAGTGGVGQVAGVLLSASGPVSGKAYAFRLGANDTPATTAAALAALIPGASATGAALTCPSAPVEVLIGADVTTLTEIRRQEQGIRVTAWCPDPASRDAVCAAIDIVLADTPWIALADQSEGRLTYRSTAPSDKAENVSLFRRDLIYTVEYPTTQTQVVPVVLWPGFSTNGTEFGDQPPS